MSSPSDTTPHDPLDPQPLAPAPMSEPHPMYWSVRRELWENRSVYLAPLIVAAFVLFGCFIATLTPGRGRTGSPSVPGKQQPAIATPISMAPAPIMFTTFLVGFIYCLDALYGERRDRSILFWKSLPVSDLTTVLSKASIPLVVLPVIGFALGVATQLLLMPVTVAVSLSLQYRMTGAMKEAFAHDAQSKEPIIRFSELTPLNFLSTPGLWVGLIFAAACLAAAVRLRRNREPI